MAYYFSVTTTKNSSGNKAFSFICSLLLLLYYWCSHHHFALVTTYIHFAQLAFVVVVVSLIFSHFISVYSFDSFQRWRRINFNMLCVEKFLSCVHAFSNVRFTVLPSCARCCCCPSSVWQHYFSHLCYKSIIIILLALCTVWSVHI